ncbi:MAG: tyrosine-type recombinase/integrase [Gemmatimonadales bacterium]
MTARTTWSYSAGIRGATVRVYERDPGGFLWIAAYDPTLREGRGGYRRRSLGHRDRDLAKKEARRVATALEQGKTATHDPSLGYVLALYRRHEITRHKAGTLRWLRPALDLWENWLGAGFRCSELGPREWEAYKDQRRAGAIDAHGRPVAADQRRAVRPGTVNLGLDALTMALNWAVRWRVENRPLIERNPTWRLPYLDDVNPRRAVWTWDRYQKLLAAAERMTMQVEWHGRRERVPCHLADILVVSEGTGRRIGAVRQLRAADLRPGEGKYGKIAWPADTDKTGKAWLTPITRDVRERLLQVMRGRQAVGDAPLFPAPRDHAAPVDRETLASWLRKAQTAAGVPRLEHDSFHGLRRKWSTERKHLPDVDVAKAGGWRSIMTMKRAYQQADEAGVLEAVLDPRRLREQGA